MSITLSMQTPVMLCELLPIAPIAIAGPIKEQEIYTYENIHLYFNGICHCGGCL